VKEGIFNLFGTSIWASNYPATSAVNNCKLLLENDTGDVITDYKKFLKSIGRSVSDKCRRRRGKKVKIPLKIRDLPTASDEAYDPEGKSFAWQACQWGATQISDNVYGLFGYDTINSNIAKNYCEQNFPDTT